MEYKSEKQILKLIKYIPTVFIILISIVITTFLYLEERNNFQIDKLSLQEEYRQDNKKIIGSRVQRVHSYISSTLKNTEEELKLSLKNEVNQAYKIAMNIYKENRSKSKEEIEKLIKDALRVIRFNSNRGYFFIYEMEGRNILNGAFPKIEGKNLWNYKDARGTLLIQEMNKILKTKNETFYDWYWYKPDQEKRQYKKVGFFKKFEPFDWFIGTGEYIDDFRKDIKEKILSHIRKLRFNEINYIYVIDFKGNFLVHVNKEYEGINYKKIDDKSKQKIVEEIISIGKNKEAYLQYKGVFNPYRQKAKLKTVFIKGYKDLKWVIGTGFYEDELNARILERKNQYVKRYKKYIRDLIIISILSTLFLLLISIYISKRLEKKFKIYQNEIRKHIEENSKQQEVLAQQTKMAAMGEMIGNIAHQWRQPLSTITTSITSIKLQKELGLLDDQTFEKRVKNITSSAEFLSRTIDDFRNFFKTDKKMAKCSTLKMLKKIQTLISFQFSSNNIKIKKNIEDIEFQTIENELIQVLLNILNNAKDELNKIEDKKLEKLVFIDIFKEENILVIKIKDNAGGVSPFIIKRIFEPYFTTKHKSQGTGIGLYMSEEIISKHLKGELSVENENFTYEGKNYRGAVFTIRLTLVHM